MLRCSMLVAAATFVLLGSSAGSAREWFVDPTIGRDDAPGTKEAPLALAQRAVDQAQPGDTVHLGPPDTVYRQSIVFRGKTNVTLDGHGVTLDGSDPLPADGWETVGPGLRRRRMPAPKWNRHLLSFDGRTEHMARTQASNPKPFPAPEQLSDGQFAVVPIDETSEWLYVRGDAKSLEWSTRINGLATSGENLGLVVRNLNARRFLNDGFNIHGNSRDLQFEKIDGYDCFDEGFSAHDTCTCRITDGRFWGSENAVADVNDCETDYVRCEFSRSLSVDCLLVGRRHSLTDCRIVNTPPSTALSGGVRGNAAKPFTLELTRVAIVSTDSAVKPRARLDGGTIIVNGCKFDDVAWNVTRADVQLTDSTVPPTKP